MNDKTLMNPTFRTAATGVVGEDEDPKDLPVYQRPTAIRMCSGTNISSNILNSEVYEFTQPDLSGFQVIYGSGENALAGAAHGSVDYNCELFQFPEDSVL